MSSPNRIDIENNWLISPFAAAPTVLSVASATATVESSALTPGTYRIISDLDIIFKASPLGFVTDVAIPFLNELKADLNLHMANATVHSAADALNPITAPNASSQASAFTLATAIKTGFEAHRQNTTGGTHGAADSTNTISASNATTLATLIALCAELLTDVYAHSILTAGSVHANADNIAMASATPANLAITTGHFLPARSEKIIQVLSSAPYLSVLSKDGSSTGYVWLSRQGLGG